MTGWAEELPRQLALGITAAAILAGALTLAATRRTSLALQVFLDLLLAAGLLRLVGDPGWPAIATAASIVALRMLIGLRLRGGGASWGRGGSRAGPVRKLTLRRLVRPAWRS